MIIAVDTGGTKTLVAEFSKNGKIKKKHRFPTPQSTSDYIQQLARLIKVEYDLEKASAISIAIPGIVKKDGVVFFAPHLSWRNFDVTTELRKALNSDVPIIVENDANLAGLAETHSLSPMPNLALYVTISTGIGTGIITRGTLDPLFSGSEGGHMQLEFDGVLHDWDAFASGLAMYETYGRYAKDITSKAIWEKTAEKIARGFLALVPVLQPEVIIIGGSIGTYFNRYNTIIERLIDDRMPEYINRPRLIQAKHPEEAVVYGCYLYATQQLA